MYDYGSRNVVSGTPRALWMGLEWVRYALGRVWFGKQAKVSVGNKSYKQNFEAAFSKLDPAFLEE